jgi:prepilin-type N-terminal cleavage/methylation domain-containing protein
MRRRLSLTHYFFFSRSKGFTLVELLVCLSLVGVISGLAAVGIHSSLDTHRTDANATAQFLRTTRSRALASVHSYVITPESSSSLVAEAVVSCKDRRKVTSVTPIKLFVAPYLRYAPLSWDLCFESRGLMRGQSDGSVTFDIINDKALNSSVRAYSLTVGLGGEVSLEAGSV